MNQLLSVIAVWLSANFGLPAMQEPPAVEFVLPSTIAALRYGEISSRQRRQTVSVYDDGTRTIYLAEGWTGETPRETSVLVHEMVHHLQNLAGHRYECAAAREALAYRAQKEWLELFGLDLASEFAIDAFTLKVTTSCMR